MSVSSTGFHFFVSSLEWIRFRLFRLNDCTAAYEHITHLLFRCRHRQQPSTDAHMRSRIDSISASDSDRCIFAHLPNSERKMSYPLIKIKLFNFPIKYFLNQSCKTNSITHHPFSSALVCIEAITQMPTDLHFAFTAASNDIRWMCYKRLN